MEGAGKLGGFEWVEEGREVVFCKIEEVNMCSECKEGTQENHGTDLRFSNINWRPEWDVPDAEGFWNLLAFLEIDMMRVGE